MDVPSATPIPQLPGAWLAQCPLPDTPDPTMLTPSERTLFERLPEGTRRRSEWWAGRIAARGALRACGLGEVSVLKAKNGAPRLEGPDAHRMDIAITHGRTLAAAVATRRDARYPHIGVDLVDVSDGPRIEKIAHRVLKPVERPLCEADPRMYLVCWGAREAAAKATRTGMFVFALSGVWVETITPTPDGEGRARVHPPDIDVFYRFLPDGAALVLAGATPEAVAEAQAIARD